MLQVVGEFSAVTAVALSFVRKSMSLIISYTLFPKAFYAGHAVGLILVASSVVLHSFRRQFFPWLHHGAPPLAVSGKALKDDKPLQRLLRVV
jgi:hypothetical protein